MTETETAWLAGILEGEGSFGFNHSPIIQLQMTDEDIVARVAALTHKPYWKRNRRPHQNKDVFQMSICAQKAIDVMQAIVPFMGQRRTARIHEVIALAKARRGIAKGQRAAHAKLTDEQAQQIRLAYRWGSRKPGERSSDLARRFGITQAALWYVMHRRQAA